MTGCLLTQDDSPCNKAGSFVQAQITNWQSTPSLLTANQHLNLSQTKKPYKKQGEGERENDHDLLGKPIYICVQQNFDE